MKKALYLLCLVVFICLALLMGRIMGQNFRLTRTVEENKKASAIEQATSKENEENLEEQIRSLESKMADMEDSREGTYPIEKIKSIDLSGINKLMISTHPDDEMFWGGGHLIEDDYLVVCVTCGMDDNRREEFERVMSLTGDKYIMLTYPRVVEPSLNREFNWLAASYLSQDLANIINLKDWDMIVTHNPDGEYGHKYHKLTSQVVTSLVKDKTKFYYFGKYYTALNVSGLSKDTLDEEVYNKKRKIIYNNYLSQIGSANRHGHMFKNENFIKYSDWK